MGHSPKAVFDFSMERAKHMLSLYDILHNSRQRSGRRDWLGKFKTFMRWPVNENIVRIDGKDKKSLLIMRESLGVSNEHFAHFYVSELLRSSIVSSVSAMDRYFHDLILLKSWPLLNESEELIPKKLKNLPIPAYAVRKALESLRKDPKVRLGNQMKKEIQNVLHGEYTFQSVAGVDNAVSMLGIQNFWAIVGVELELTAGQTQQKVREIARRRNQIVHEADIILKTKGKEIGLREITKINAEDAVTFISNFIEKVDAKCNR